MKVFGSKSNLTGAQAIGTDLPVRVLNGTPSNFARKWTDEGCATIELSGTKQ